MTTVPKTVKRVPTHHEIVKTVKEIVRIVTGLDPDTYKSSDHFTGDALQVDDLTKADILHLVESEYDVLIDSDLFSSMNTPNRMAEAIGKALSDKPKFEALELFRSACFIAFELPGGEINFGKHLVIDFGLHPSYLEKVAEVLTTRFNIGLNLAELCQCKTVDDVVDYLRPLLSL